MQEVEVRERVALSASEWDEVRRILEMHVPDIRVWAFGSRVTGRTKPFSDLDLGLETTESLHLAKEAELTEAFEESDLPFRVDLVDLTLAEASFASHVRCTGVLLQ